MVNNRRPPLLALVAALAASQAATAAEWVAEPSITLRGEFDDNYRLTRLPHDDVWGMIVDPRLRLSRNSELWDLTANGRVRSANYTGEDGLNTVDNFFDAAAKRHLERGSLDISGSLINDTTLQDEFLDGDTGLTIFQIDRTQRNVRLAGNYMLTESNWIEASVGYTEFEYDEGEQFGLLNYDYLSPGIRVVHQYEQNIQLFGILNHSKVNYDNYSDLESKTDSLQLGASYDITETWNINGSVGRRRTNTSESIPVPVERPGFEILFPFVYDLDYLPRDDETTGLVYDASLTREFETGSLVLSATQSITPSSTGTDTESTRINLIGKRQLRTKLSAGLAVSYYQSSTVGDVTTRADSDRYRIAPSLTWQIDKDLILNTVYTYTEIKQDAAGDDTVDSNKVYVSLGYSWPRIAMSR